MLSDESLAAWLASLPPEERDRQIREIAPTDEDRFALEYSWDFWARPTQLAPIGEWRTWLIKSGRGWGKTRTGAEWTRYQVGPGEKRRGALVGRSAGDVRDVMVEGESGLIAIAPPWFRPKYEPSKRRLTWPNGATATTFSADEYDQLRGPQFDFAWCDELAAWRYAIEAWDMLMFGLRLGDDPRVCVTTTPRPTKIVRDLMKDPTTRVTHGSTFDNRANLAGPFLEKIVAKYEGTRLGRQELGGEVLDDTPGALWKRDQIESLRIAAPRVDGLAPFLKNLREQMTRIVVAIDPSVTNTEESDECGIVVAGLGKNDHGYVFDDLSAQMSANEWAQVAVKALAEHDGDRIVAEVNNGGDLVEITIRISGKNAPYRGVHAAHGKATRAEPIAALYEQKRVHHVGCFPKLEDEMCTWVPGEKSPNRMDALVWALSDLMLESAGESFNLRNPSRR